MAPKGGLKNETPSPAMGRGRFGHYSSCQRLTKSSTIKSELLLPTVDVELVGIGTLRFVGASQDIARHQCSTG